MPINQWPIHAGIESCPYLHLHLNKTDMRRFRFVGDPKDYSVNEPNFMVGGIYDGSFTGKDCASTVEQYAYMSHSAKDWKEVFDNDGGTILTTCNPLHKDTDLGYFAGLAMAALFVSYITETGLPRWDKPDLAKEAIEQAKELIKQLNEQTK